MARTATLSIAEKRAGGGQAWRVGTAHLKSTRAMTAHLKLTRAMHCIELLRRRKVRKLGMPDSVERDGAVECKPSATGAGHVLPATRPAAEER